jgi:small subunit ribosomal protein S9
MKIKEFVGVGRRKTAVASVRMRTGAGTIIVNGKKFEEVFPDSVLRQAILAPLHKVAAVDRYNLLILLKGGGTNGQSEAARLGIARALVLENEERRHDLKALGYLRRDPRKKERQKYGRAGARKRFQFSKR